MSELPIITCGRCGAMIPIGKTLSYCSRRCYNEYIKWGKKVKSRSRRGVVTKGRQA